MMAIYRVFPQLDSGSMSNSMEQIVGEFPKALVSIRTYGPPRFQGDSPHRVAIDGNPEGFRMLARMLNLMADTVETRSDKLGWYLVLGTDNLTQLRMDDEHLLVLSCDPDTNAESWDNPN